MNNQEYAVHLHKGHIHSDELSIFSVLEHSFLDILPMIPILIITFIIIEYMEHKFSGELQEKVRNAGLLGPIFGALIGTIPQCGFSVMAVALYSKKVISLGTMMSIFIATSDEALPVFLSIPDSYGSILPFIITKIVIAIIAGYIIDIVLKRFASKNEVKYNKDIEKIGHKCVDTENIKFYKVFLHSIERTLKVLVYIYIVTFIITFLIEYLEIETFAGTFLSEGFSQIFIASVVGLIPNCAISVGLVKLFTMNVISFSSVIAGLSSNAGLALIFLFKESKSKAKALLITLLLLGISFISGVIIHILKI